MQVIRCHIRDWIKINNLSQIKSIIIQTRRKKNRYCHRKHYRILKSKLLWLYIIPSRHTKKIRILIISILSHANSLNNAYLLIFKFHKFTAYKANKANIILSHSLHRMSISTIYHLPKIKSLKINSIRNCRWVILFLLGLSMKMIANLISMAWSNSTNLPSNDFCCLSLIYSS